MDRDSLQYDDVCPDCYSLDLMFFNTREEDGVLHFSVTCRDCGSEWLDMIEIG